jgi:hypothetical protein
VGEVKLKIGLSMINKIQKQYHQYLVFFASKEEILFFVLLSFLLIYRILLLLSFGIQYVDGDQAIMWLATTDYAQGIFHEPCFYGQSYLLMIEAILAVPLYKSGVQLHIALPLVTSMLAISPFVVIALFLRKSGAFGTGIFVLALPLLLPPEYDLLTSLPRGFVGGIGVGGLALIPFFNHGKKGSVFLFFLLSAIGFIINPNVILLAGPCSAYLFFIYRKNPRFYASSFGALLIGATIYMLIKYFYHLNPTYDLHNMELVFSISNVFSTINDVDKFFNFITPLFWKQGFLLLLAPISFFISSLIKRAYPEAIFSVTLLIILLLSFGLTKTHDGTNSIFMSYARMFLGIPVSLAVLLVFNRKTFSALNLVVFILALLLMATKLVNLRQTIDKHVQSSTIVSVIEVKKMENQCDGLHQVAIDNGVDLIVVINHWLYDLYTYGCPAMEKTFPKTLRPAYERRTWRLVEDAHAVYPTILFISDNADFSLNFDFVESVPEKEGLFLIRNNILSTLELFESLGIEVREF